MSTEVERDSRTMRNTSSTMELVSLSMPTMESGALSISPDRRPAPVIAAQPVLDLDPRAVRELVLYIAVHVQEPTFHRIVKLLYFADKLHLARYGRTMTGDRYIAMEYGSVPSYIYDMLKAARSANSAGLRDVEPAFTVRGDGYTVMPLRAADIDWISDSERVCLDETISQYGALSFGRLTDLSHDSAWSGTNRNLEIPVEAIIASIAPFAERATLLEHLHNPNP